MLRMQITHVHTGVYEEARFVNIYEPLELTNDWPLVMDNTYQGT